MHMTRLMLIDVMSVTVVIRHCALITIACCSFSACKILLLVYLHMLIGKVWVRRLLFVCLFVWLWISLLRIKLVASNFARRFVCVQGRESPIL